MICRFCSGVQSRLRRLIAETFGGLAEAGGFVFAVTIFLHDDVSRDYPPARIRWKPLSLARRLPTVRTVMPRRAERKLNAGKERNLFI